MENQIMESQLHAFAPCNSLCHHYYHTILEYYIHIGFFEYSNILIFNLPYIWNTIVLYLEAKFCICISTRTDHH